MPPEPPDLVDLVAKALDVLEDEGEAGLDRFLARHPDQSATIKRRLSMLVDTGLEPAAPTAAKADLPGELDGFRLIRTLGAGGMGVVWLAEERALGREVALKLVRPDQLLFPGARERFQREVEVIARLQHPGIVPVYSVGEANGMPYFAMEYVQGSTLSDAVKALGASEGRDPSGPALMDALPAGEQDDGAATTETPRLFQGPWHDVCARIATEIADALEHARRRGVVHRDVKPSNVMITRGGRVQLFDFGLSARQGDARLTRTGAMVGSLAYMPPEAMRADADVEDTRQDVYGLGVTLYELLAGSLPFPVNDVLTLRAAVESGDARPLRRARPSIPVDLAAIVGKAMERDASRRYETPGELAADLDRFLSRRPVEARSPGAVLRTVRWVQRSPARAAALAALVLTPTILFAQELANNRVVEAKNESIEEINKDLVEANEGLKAALVEVEEQRAIAERSFLEALKAIETLLVETALERLPSFAGLDVIRRDILEQALELYEWFLAQEYTTPEIQEQVAVIARRTADISGFLADPARTEEALARSEELLDVYEEGDPDLRPSARIGLADTKQRQALGARLRGDVQGARELVAEGLGILDDLDWPRLNGEARMQVRRSRSGLLTEEAQCQVVLGERDTATAILEEAVDLLRTARESAPDQQSLRYDLSRALDILASMRVVGEYDGIEPPTSTGPIHQALDELAEALDLALELLEQDPPHALARFRVGRVLVNRSYAELALDRRDAAAETLQEALFHQGLLVEENPDVPQYAVDYAGGLLNRARGEHLAGAFEDAYATRRIAVELLAPLAPTQPGNEQLQTLTASAFGQLAAHAAVEGRSDELESTGRSALSLIRRGRQFAPNGRFLQAEWGANWRTLVEATPSVAGRRSLLRIAGAHLAPDPVLTPDLEPDWEGFARLAVEILALPLEDADPRAARRSLLQESAELLSAALHANDTDVFALIDTDAGAALLDLEGFGEALDEALAKER